MGKIVRLDDSTINKIAAGEVIERPASVIKEMCENSIDAGANNITIEIRNGGISYIRITDNGSGIEKDDMEIAFERHATSKIRSADDLFRVKSMGFRGEALASVAAIAKVEMTSRTANSDIGYRIIVEGGKVLEFTEVGCPIGTTIVVRNLFFNTPVRYKFLKKDYTESGYIEDAVAKIALANPSVSIRYVNTGKTVIQTQGADDLKSIVYSIYGKDVADGILDVNYTYDSMKVKGVIGRPEIARSNRSNQIFFVNKRNVKDKTLTAATEQAYKGLLPIGKFAFVVLNIEMDSSKVDVNVHPAKLEVRFEEENQVFKAIYSAIKDTLAKLSLEQDINNQIQNVFDSQKSEFESKKITSNEKALDFNKKVEKDYKEIEEDNAEAEKESRGIVGFIKKIHREQTEETEEELNNNSLKEIYEFRNELKKIGVQPVSSVPATINSNTASIEIKQNTMPLKLKEEDVTNTVITDDEFGMSEHKNVDDFIKSTNEKAKQIIASYYQTDKRSSNKEERVEKLYSEKINTDIQNTKIVDNKIVAEKEVEDKKEEIKEQPISSFIDNQATEQINNRTITNIELVEKEINENPNSVDEINDTLFKEEEIKVVSPTVEPTVIIKDNGDSKPTTDNVTQKLMENIEKNEKERTQIIDTNQVRTAIQEMRKASERSSNFDEMYSKVFGKPPIADVPEQENENQVDGIELKDDDLGNKQNENNDTIVEDENTQNQESVTENVSIFEDNKEFKVEERNYRYIGLALEEYIIVELKSEMYIIDKKLACEKLIFEKVRYDFEHYKPENMQTLLIPDIITLDDKQTEIIKQTIGLFNQGGFELQEFGEKTLKLVSVPNMCVDLNTKQLFIDLLEEVNSVPITEEENIKEKFMLTISKRIADEHVGNLSNEEICKIVEDLFKLPEPFIMGKSIPIATRITRSDLEKKFSRRK